MSPYTKTTWVANVTPVTAVSMNNIENGIASMSAATSATPPGSPVDGQIWYLPADAANGVVWAFRYNSGSASAYKWEFIGGSAMRATVATQEGTTNTGNAALATPGPTFTLPRAGDYEALFGAFAYNLTAGLGARMALYVNAGDTGVACYSGTSYYNSVAATGVVNAAGANYGIGLFYAALGGGTASFGSRYLMARPVRVS